MIAVAAGFGIAIAVLGGLSAAGFVGYAYGTRLIEFERSAKETYLQAHTTVSKKLAAVKAEIDALEASGYADVTSSVHRIKSLFLTGGGSGGGGNH